MWRKINANPAHKQVGDCVIRAISMATGMPWLDVYDALYWAGRGRYDMPNSNEVWGDYLYRMGRSYGGSYARGRDMRTGRYVSRDDGYAWHHPMEYIDPMLDRRM